MSIESAILDGAGDFLKHLFHEDVFHGTLHQHAPNFHELMEVDTEEVFDFPDMNSDEFRLMMKLFLEMAAKGLITLTIVALAGGGIRIIVKVIGGGGLVGA